MRFKSPCRLLRRYLQGYFPEDESALVEERIMTDEEFFYLVNTVEGELRTKQNNVVIESCISRLPSPGSCGDGCLSSEARNASSGQVDAATLSHETKPVRQHAIGSPAIIEARRSGRFTRTSLRALCDLRSGSKWHGTLSGDRLGRGFCGVCLLDLCPTSCKLWNGPDQSR